MESTLMCGFLKRVHSEDKHIAPGEGQMGKCQPARYQTRSSQGCRGCQTGQT